MLYLARHRAEIYSELGDGVVTLSDKPDKDLSEIMDYPILSVRLL